MEYVFDIEADSLNATIIHCLSYYSPVGSRTLFSYESIKLFLESLKEDDVLIGHNIIRYDIPTLKRLLNANIKCILVDTLALSWTLYPNMNSHGLESWGEYLGIKKPLITDWQNLSKEEYAYRCETDVSINTKLWVRQLSLLKQLYGQNYLRYCSYLTFKMDCVREQEEIGIALDVKRAQDTLDKLSKEKESRLEQLRRSIPKNPIKKRTTYKDSYQDSNGNIQRKGELFANPMAYFSDITIEEIVGYEEPNPNSIPQLKNWLYSLGWVPEHVKFDRDKKTNEISQIPQIKSKFKDDEVCDSIKKLFEKEPSLELLNGIFVISHRISIFKAFLGEQVNGRLYPSCAGLTNTLRLQHKVVVNLPGIFKPYGEDIRGCLLADEGKWLCGSDLSGIEDSTKRHYIYKYDPDYVNEMSIPGYDPHLDIAVLAGFLTKEQAEEHKLYEATKGKEGKSYKAIRQKAKTTNFSATYKVGVPSLSRNAGIPVKEAKKLLDIYWKRNKAILDVEKSLTIKEINGQKWLLNPVSGFWYTLRADKDKFSTLNQGTAVYVFDSWVRQIRKQGIQISYQCHDEWLANVGDKEKTKEQINTAVKIINEELKLNVPIGCSADFGHNYSECH